MHPTHDPVITPAHLLHCAARYLRRHGWIQGDYYRHGIAITATPPVCAVGAIAMAAYGAVTDAPSLQECPEVADFHRAVDALDLYLRDTRDADLYTWNDTDGRTAEQVIAALNEAADEWDRAHAPGGAL